MRDWASYQYLSLKFRALEQLPCNHKPLDFARALINLRDARIAVISFDIVVRQIAVAAMNLYGVGAHPLGHLRGVQFSLAGFGKAGLTLAAQAGGVVGQEARRADGGEPCLSEA